MKIQFCALPLALATGILLSTSSWAQVIPDNTLGADRSVINRVDEGSERIFGGATRGENLFHSFREFSIGSGSEVYFFNPEGISNIFSRVTGSNISEILGTLGVKGNANLFFLNPNGIVFGENAFVDVAGSFIATTADEIKFGDGQVFSARDAEKPSVLLRVPIGLGLNGNNGNIIVRGKGHELLVPPFSPTINPETQAGLQVSPGSTLALIGGDIILDGAILKAKSGQIELGSVSSEGNVALDINSSDSVVSYEGVSSFGDIQFLNKSLVDTSSIDSNFDSGNIRVFGGNISIKDGSVLLIQQQDSSLGGDLSINATESLFIAGTDPLANVDNFRINSSLRNENLGTGINGNTQVLAKEITLQDGGQILNLSFSKGAGGDLNVSASDKIQTIGRSPLNINYSSNISTATFNSGDAGNLTLSTKNLKLMGGSGIASANFGSGKGGNVLINSTNLIEIIGIEPSLLAGSNISASTLNSGNAGNLTINTSNLVIQDGGRIDSSTFADGDSGSITLNVSDSIKIDGMVTGSPNPSSIISAGNIISEDLQKLLRLPSIPSGNAGSLTINTPNLNITNGAAVGVQNFGTGDAGILEINSDSINLNNAGSIAASTLFGNGGNINLNAERIQIENNSNISASAGGEGNGGNVNITSDTLLALNDSDVTATAEKGNGGNIRIDADGSFGIQERKATPGNGTSDADASSEFGEDGTVTITNPQSNIQDPVAAFREPEITIMEPEFQADCFEQQRLLNDLRHPDFQEDPNDFSDNTETSITNDFVSPEPETRENDSIENLVWSEGKPLVPGDHLVVSPDGELFWVVKSEFESLRKKGCISPEFTEYESNTIHK